MTRCPRCKHPMRKDVGWRLGRKRVLYLGTWLCTTCYWPFLSHPYARPA